MSVTEVTDLFSCFMLSSQTNISLIRRADKPPATWEHGDRRAVTGECHDGSFSNRAGCKQGNLVDCRHCPDSTSFAVLFGYILHSSRHATFEVSETGLRIRGDLYGRGVPARSLITSQATKIDLRYDRQHQPKWRNNGVAMPGYLSGWFRLRNGEKALLFVTDRQRVVYVPTRDRYSLLLSVQDPDRFLSALQRLPQ